MKRRRNTSKSLFEGLSDAVTTGLSTCITLSVRMPQLMTGTMKPAEMNRMVSEKVAATTEGAMRGGAAMGKLITRRRKAITPLGIAADMGSIVEASTRPARKRVKANAARLTGLFVRNRR